MFGLTDDELRVFRTLSTPQKIQDYLDALPINHEKDGETCFSPRRVLREQKAHCLEAALFAGVALWLQGEKPLVITLKTARGDDDHALALFRLNGYYGALSKTNHGVLRYRDPIYKTVRELALSYFNEYFLDDGRKTLQSYSKPLNLRRFGSAWITAEKDLWHIADTLATHPHLSLIPAQNKPHIRKADPFERTTYSAVEWPLSDPRT